MAETINNKILQLDEIFDRALSERASDIHIEPMNQNVVIRFRIDGRLQERWSHPIEELDPIINRIKVLAGMDITDHSKPQDGHFELIKTRTGTPQMKKLSDTGGPPTTGSLSAVSGLSKIFSREKEEAEEAGEVERKKEEREPVYEIPQNDSLNIRASIFPTVDGDVAVLRLLDQSSMLLSLHELGIGEKDLSVSKNLISKIYGMVLITGPSGSGKTTTLYSILRETKNLDKNIITLEDPVEYDFSDIRQSQINPAQGFTFAMGMRSILRQDPDIIMIGEIRDSETAENAVRAALTGRIVFSTVHSNSSIGTIARLLDMNIERSLIAYSINGIITQRLVRKICPHCMEKYTPSHEYLTYFNLNATDFDFKKGAGCEECNNTGYKGRTGIFELLVFDDELRSMIIEKASMIELQKYAEKNGMKTLKTKALEAVEKGITTLEEAASVV